METVIVVLMHYMTAPSAFLSDGGGTTDIREADRFRSLNAAVTRQKMLIPQSQLIVVTLPLPE